MNLNSRIFFLACYLCFGFSSNLMASECHADLENLVEKMKYDNSTLYNNTAYYFITREQYKDPDGTLVESKDISEATSIRKYGRIIPSKADNESENYVYELYKGRRKNPRVLIQSDSKGKEISSYIFRKNKKKCWVLERKSVLLKATEEQIEAAKQESLVANNRHELSASVLRSNSPRNSKRAKAESNIMQFTAALIHFNSDTGRYPTQEEGINILIYTPNGVKPIGHKRGGYLKPHIEDLRDPWGNRYRYLLEPCAHFVSYGEDGKPGGSGAALDIGNCS